MRMRARLAAVAILAAMTALAGCCDAGMVRAEALEPAYREVRARHDRYVTGDADLSAADKALYLRTSRLLQDVLDEAQKP